MKLKDIIGSMASKFAALALALTCVGNVWGAETTTIKNAADEDITVYVVSSGFYQKANTYEASTDFYITSKAGLEYFRDLVNQVGTVADTYVLTFVQPATATTAAGWYTTSIFGGKTVHLMTDVDLNNEEWSPIGEPKNTAGDRRYFYGNFNGENHTIRNLKATQYTKAIKTWNPGLFGFIGSQAGQTFSNLTIANVTLVGYDYAGAVVGNAGSNATAFNNCHVTGAIDIKCMMMTDAFVGGIVGIGTCAIDDCSVEGTAGSTIQGSTVGGLAGTSTRTAKDNANTVTDSTVTGVTVKSKDNGGQAGGLVGKATNPVTVKGNTVHDVTVSAEAGKADVLVGGVGGAVTASSNTTDTNVTVISDPYAAYVKVADGFYQNAATYAASTDFYITNLNGLKFFRDLVNGDADVCAGYPELPANRTIHAFSGKTVHLIADIDLGNELWEPIGYAYQTNERLQFEGSFDGGIYDAEGNLTGTHTIANLNVAISSGKYYAGLFGVYYASQNSTLKNLTLNGVNITSGQSAQGVGAFVGSAKGAQNGVTLENLHVIGSVNIVGSTSYVGGIVGDGRCTIKNCSVVADGTIKGTYNVGGISGGILTRSTGMYNCAVADVTVQATAYNYGLGALAGFSSALTVSNCTVSAVTVKCDASSYAGSGMVGLLVGFADSTSAYTILSDNTVINATATEYQTPITTQIGAYNADYSIVGSNITFDESGKVTGGIFENIPASAIASGYVTADNPNTETNESYPLTVGGPYAAVIYDENDAFVGGYNGFKAAIDAANASSSTELTVKLLCDIEEPLPDDLEAKKTLLITTDVTGGVELNLHSESYMAFLATANGCSVTFDSNVNVTGIRQLGTYADTAVLNLNNPVRLSQFYAAGGTININPDARIRFYHDGAMHTWGAKYVINGSLGAGEGLTATVASVGAENLQIDGGYVNYRYNAGAAFTMSNAIIRTQFSNGAPGDSNTFPVTLYNSVIYATGSSFSMGTTSQGTLTLIGSRIVADGATVDIDANDNVVMDWKSSITATTFANNGVINIDATGIAEPVKVIDYTGSGTMALANYGTVNVTGGEAYVEESDLWVKKLPVAQIVTDAGATTTKYATLAAAVADAQSGDTIEMIADVTGENVTVTKSVTITGASDAEGNPAITLENTQLTLSGTMVELAVTNLAFTGSSYINANNGKALTVDHVTAVVDPTKCGNCSRSAFIVLSATEHTTGLDLTVTHSTIVNTSGTDSYGAAIFGWAYLKSATICDNVLGSDSYRFRFIAVKLMNAVDGATYTIERNMVYGTNASYNFYAFDLYQNCSRDNSYTAVSKANVVDVTATGSHDFFVFRIERKGIASTKTIVIDSASTLNGEAVTLNDFLDELKVNAGFYGAGVVYDANGKMTAGTFNRELSDAELEEFVAEGLRSFAVGDGTYTLDVPVAQIGDVKYASFEKAIADVQDGETILLLADVTLDEAAIVSKNLTITLDGHSITGTITAGSGYELVTSDTAYVVRGAGYAGEVLPAGPDMSGDVINVTAANAQYTLDGAYGDINGKTINFTENITERLDLGRCTKYAGSGTTTSGTYPNHTRTLSNVTFTSSEGVTIAGFTANSRHVCSNGDYDYVRDQAVTGTNDGYYKYSSLTGITFEGLTVSDNIFVIYGLEGTTCGDITFDGCTFTGNTSDTAPINFNNNGSFQYGDITIQNCTINGSKAGIYINGGAAEYTIKNNYVVAGSNNAIQLWAVVGSAATVDIEGNFLKSDKYTVNLYRFESEQITFTGNAVVAGARGHLGHFQGDASGNFWAPQGATPDASGNMTSTLTEPIPDTSAVPGENDITSSSYYSTAVVDTSAAQWVTLSNLHKFVAQVGDVKYTSFADAIAAAGENDEIIVLDETATVPAGWKIADNKLVQIVYVAQVGETKYENLMEAINVAYNGGTVELLTDVTVDYWHQNIWTLADGYAEYPDGWLREPTTGPNGLTINGNGYSLTINASDSGGNGNQIFAGSRNLTVSNITINAASGVSGIGLKSGTISNVTFNMAGPSNPIAAIHTVGSVGCEEGEHIEILNCTFNTSASDLYAIVSQEDGEDVGTVISGNTFNTRRSVILRSDMQFLNNVVNGAKGVTVDGGSTAVVRGNIFADTTTSRSIDAYPATATYEYNVILGPIEMEDKTYEVAPDFSGNYWGGNAPANLPDGAVYSSYYTTCTMYDSPAQDGSLFELSNLVSLSMVTFELDGTAPAGTTLPSDGAYAVDSTLPLPTYESDDKTFAGWKVKNSDPAVIITVLPAGTTGDITLVATWTGAKTIKINAGGTEPTTIKVTDEWLEANDLADEEDPAVIKAALEKSVNGVPAWESYVLGQSIGAAVSSGAEQGETTLMPVTSTIDVPAADTGFDVKYRLDTVNADGDVVAAGTAQATPDLALELSGVADSAYYRLAAVVTAKDGSGASVSVQANNTIGVLAVNSAAKSMIVAVPWASLDDGGEISVSNLVRTATLTPGDTINAYDAKTKKYKAWTLSNEKVWEPTPVIGGSDESGAGAYTVPRGAGVWLTRSDTSKPLYLVGGTSASDVVTAIEPSVGGRPAWNLVASPSVEPVNLSTLLNGKEDQAGVVVPTAGAPKTYTFKDGAWGYDTTEPVIKNGKQVGVRSVRKTDDVTVPAGTGFWYLNSSESPDVKIEW